MITVEDLCKLDSIWNSSPQLKELYREHIRLLVRALQMSCEEDQELYSTPNYWLDIAERDLNK